MGAYSIGRFLSSHCNMRSMIPLVVCPASRWSRSKSRARFRERLGGDREHQCVNIGEMNLKKADGRGVDGRGRHFKTGAVMREDGVLYHCTCVPDAGVGVGGELGDVAMMLLMHHPYAIAGTGAGAYDRRSGGHGMHSLSAHVTLGIHTVRYRWVMSE
jgi:hypothetical protein